MNDSFKKGFIKTAGPELTEQSYDGYGDDYKDERQAILEASYDKNDKPGTKQQKLTKKVVEQGPSYLSNPSSPHLTERT